MVGNCEFCKREKELTFHHYIPRTLHTNKYFKKMFEKEYMKIHGVNLYRPVKENYYIFSVVDEFDIP